MPSSKLNKSTQPAACGQKETMNTKNETSAGELTNAEIREILLAHSYEIKPGFADLKWYVYDGARAVVAADRALRLVATPAGDVAMPVMAWLHDWLCEGKLAQDWISQQESNANTPGSCNIRPLVKQADALAALTAKDAEIARLRKEVAEAWAAHNVMRDERDTLAQVKLGAQAGPVLLTDEGIDAVIDRPVNALMIVAHDKYGKRGALWCFARAIEAAVHAANPALACEGGAS